MMTETDMRRWRRGHPSASLYIAFVVTVELLLTLAHYIHHGF